MNSPASVRPAQKATSSPPGAILGSDSSPTPNTSHLSIHEMDELEGRFLARVEEATHPSHRLSRQRLWLIFLLLRHGALRLGEVLSLNDESGINLEDGLLHVPGPHSRDVPLPRHLIPELRRFFALPGVATRRGTLTHLDPGYVRRSFYARARECQLPPDLASPRALRQFRAVELIQGGMPLPAVQKLLGQPSLESTGEFVPYSDADIKEMTMRYLEGEARLKTSARNVFPGQVESLRHSGFLTEVRVRSFGGLVVSAVITQESMERMELVPGKTVIATVKAPLVMLSCDEAGPTSASNRFSGTILQIRRSDLLCSVVARLGEGSRVCALITTERADELKLAPDMPVSILFEVFSVVLDLP